VELIFGDITIGASFLEFNADAMDIKPFTYKSIVLKIPNAADGVYNIYEFTFLKGVSSGEIRTIGRTIGDDLGGPLFYAGFLLTVSPNLIENHLTEASIEEVLIEYIVDSSGFLVAEMAGDFVFGLGVAAEQPFAGSVAGVGADIFVGNFWEWIFYGE
jgi:hypothetical protein